VSVSILIFELSMGAKFAIRDSFFDYYCTHKFRPEPVTSFMIINSCTYHVIGDVSTLKGKGSQYSITERRVPELIPVLRSQSAGDVSHKPSGRLPLLSARPAVTPATLKRAAANFAAWWTKAQWV